MQIQPYVFFDGRCEEAIEFYRSALGAEVAMLMRYKDNPEPPQSGTLTPGTENKIMHADLRIGEATVLMSDGHCQGKPEFQGFALTLKVADDAEAQRRFAALGEGGEVRIPLARTFFSSSFGMVTDRFGVLWIVIVSSS